MFLTIFLAIVDTRSCLSTHPSKRRLSQTARCPVRCLGCVVECSDISHTLSFYFPNVIELVQRIVRFVMRTEPKASYRTVQYEYMYIYIYIYTQYIPNLHIKSTIYIYSIYIYIYIYIKKSSLSDCFFFQFSLRNS